MPIRILLTIILMKRLEWWARRLRWSVEAWAARTGQRGLCVTSRAGRVEACDP